MSAAEQPVEPQGEESSTAEQRESAQDEKEEHSRKESRRSKGTVKWFSVTKGMCDSRSCTVRRDCHYCSILQA